MIALLSLICFDVYLYEALSVSICITLVKPHYLLLFFLFIFIYLFIVLSYETHVINWSDSRRRSHFAVRVKSRQILSILKFFEIWNTIISTTVLKNWSWKYMIKIPCKWFMVYVKFFKGFQHFITIHEGEY